MVNSALEQVDRFTYLGSMLTADGKPDEEIKRRIGIAKTAYMKMECVLSSRSLVLATRRRLLKWFTYIDALL